MSPETLDQDLARIIEARHHDPFAVLGRHDAGEGRIIIRAHLPGARDVRILPGELDMERLPDTDIFLWEGPAETVSGYYRLEWTDMDNHRRVAHDPYCFPPQLPDFDLHLFGEGRHHHVYRILGAHAHEVDGIAGYLFAVWAPNAGRVSVVGDFNRWDGRMHPMRVRGGSGVWELFIPDLAPGFLYKFEIRNRERGDVFVKTDPYGQAFELRPATAAIAQPPSSYHWGDREWMERRAALDWRQVPMSIYEVHLGSWRRGPEGEFLGYRDLARLLCDHAEEMGFTHIQLMPVTEHPLDASWGYQATGYFAPTSRFGAPDDFRYFVDHCHQRGIGVLLDWVPAHFPKDAHGLARFDGEALYEHADPRKGEHLDWSTLIYNYGRHEVRNFLLASANYWIEEFHLDGLRVDAVASMLYLDYSRTDWIPNEYGGRENLEALDFLRKLNTLIHGGHPGAVVIAEESTSWPQVTRPVHIGGLGFSMKWNMGWMNDTLSYFRQEPIFRKYHHDMLTFSMLYAFSENFVLPFSHDEVVHGKASLLGKMPGDEWQRFANLRLLYTYMYTHPGKKLLFMGCEIAQGNEWDSAASIEWDLLQYPPHQGVRDLVRDLNALYVREAALHRFDFQWEGFEWIDCKDADQSVLSFLRKAGEDMLVVVVNFTPVVRERYRIGVPRPGMYQEIFNSDSTYYGGSNTGNGPDPLPAQEVPWMSHPWSLELCLPPLAGIILRVPPETGDRK